MVNTFVLRKLLISFAWEKLRCSIARLKTVNSAISTDENCIFTRAAYTALFYLRGFFSFSRSVKGKRKTCFVTVVALGCRGH